MVRLVVLSLVLFISNGVSAFQTTDQTGTSLSVQGNPGTPLFERRYIPKNEGSKFLFDENKESIIYLNAGKFNSAINIDLENGLIQLNENGKEEYLELSKMDSILIGDIRIVPSLGNLKGCLLIYSEKGYNLVDLKKAELKESNYNAAMDVGSRNKMWLVTDIFYMQKKSGKSLVELPKSKKKFSKLFKSPDQVLDFIKHKKLDITETRDLVVILDEFIESLVK